MRILARVQEVVEKEVNGSPGASAAGEGDCGGEVEERPGGFGDAGAFVAMRFVAGVMEGGSGDAGAKATGTVTDALGRHRTRAENQAHAVLHNTGNDRGERLFGKHGRSWLAQVKLPGRPAAAKAFARDRSMSEHIQEQKREISVKARGR